MLKKIRMIALTLLIVLVAFVTINLIDEPLQPQVESLMRREVVLPPSAIEAYKYFLGIQVPPDHDPMARGQKIYERHRANAERTGFIQTKDREPDEQTLVTDPKNFRFKNDYYTPSNYAPHREEFQKILAEHSVQLSRYKKLIQLGGMASDIRPTLDGGTHTIQVVLWGHRLHLMNWIDQIHSKKVAPRLALEALANEFAFCASSIRYPGTLLLTAVQAVCLRSLRSFVEGLSQHDPRFKQALTPEMQKRFSVDLQESDLAQNALQVELRVVQSLLANALPPLELFTRAELWKLGGLSADPGIDTGYTLVGISAGRSKNRILNRLYQCWLNPSARSWSDAFFPVAKSYVQVFCTGIKERRERLAETLELLRAPFPQ